MKKKLMVLGMLATVGVAASSTLTSCSDDKNPTTPEGSTSTPVVGTTQAPNPTSTPVESSSVSSSVVDPTVSSIVVSGHTSVFGIGDEISKGSAKVTAYYTDGTNKDVTSQAKFDFSQVNKDVVGTYTVSVSIAGISTSYTVEVKDYTLDSIEVEATKDDKTFYLYSAIDFSNIVIKGVYKHPIKEITNKKVLSNSDVEFVVKDSNGNEVKNQFTAYGTYTVEVSYAGKNTSFEVECKTSVINSLEDAVSSAVKAESTINGGSINYDFKDTGYDSSSSGDTDYSNSYSSSYKYGNDFVIVDKSGVKTYFSSIDATTAFAVTVDGNTVSLGSNSDFFASVEDSKLVGINFFDNGSNTHGVAAIISELFNIYNDSTSVGEKHEEKGICSHLNNKEGYKFSFTYLTEEYRYEFNRYSIEFVINESGAIESAYIFKEEFTSTINPNYSDSDTEVPSDLPVEIIKEDKDGIAYKYFKVKDGAKTSGETIWNFAQTSGVRESDNPYAPSKVAISSFNVKVGDDELADGQTIDLDLDNGNKPRDDGSHKFEIDYTISDIPSNALSQIDKVTILVSGTAADGHVLEDDDYSYAFATSYEGLKLYINKPGTYQVTFKSLLVTKTITYKVDYEAPFNISGSIHNGETDSSFVSKNEFDMYVSNTIYVGANIADGFDPNYTLEASSDYVTLEKVTYEGVECYKVTVSEAGNYTLTLKGAQSAKEGRTQATCNITLNVAADPDINTIIGQNNGIFEATVSSELVYAVEFDTTNNSIKIYDKADSTKYNTYEYTYANKAFDLGFPTTSGLDDDFTIVVGNYYDIYLSDGTKSYKLMVPEVKEPETPIDAASILNGKYTVTTEISGTTSVTSYEFVPSSEGATSGSVTIITDDNVAKAGVYNYEYDSTTKTISFVKTSGKNKYIEDKIEITSDGLFYHFNEDTKIPFIRKTEEQNKIDITDYLGTWDDGKGFTITLYEDYFTTSAGGRYTISSILYNKDNQVVIKEPSNYLTLTFISKEKMNDGYVDYTKKVESLEMASDMIGTWIDENGTAYEITSNGVIVKDSWGGDSYSFKLASVTNGKYKVVDSKDPSYYYEIYFKDDVLYAYDGYTEFELTKETQTSDEIPNEFVKEWIDYKNDIQLTISADSIKWDNMVASGYAYDSESGYISFTVVDTNYAGFINEGILQVREGTQNWYYFSEYIHKSIIGIYVDGEEEIEVTRTTFEDALGNLLKISSVTYEDGVYTIAGSNNTASGSITISNKKLNASGYEFTYQEPTNINVSDYIGKWVDSFGATLEITKDKVINSEGNQMSIVNTTINSIVYYDDFYDSNYELIINSDGTITDNNDNVYSKFNSDDAKVPETYYGTWYNVDKEMKIVINEDGIIVNDNTATNVVYNQTDKYITFNVEGYNYEFSISLSDGSLTVMNGGNYFICVSSNNIDISEYTGMYSTVLDGVTYYLYLGKSYVKFNEDEYNIDTISYSSSFNLVINASFLNRGNLLELTLTFDGKTSLIESQNFDEYTKLNLTLPEGFEGNWSNFDEYVDITISSSEILYNYEIPEEITINDNSIVITSGGNTYTFTLDNNGNLVCGTSDSDPLTFTKTE